MVAPLLLFLPQPNQRPFAWQIVFLGSPTCRPCRIMFANKPAPNNRSMDPGRLKSGSAKCSPLRCFHLPSNGKWWTGNSVVVLGRTTTITGIWHIQWLKFAMLKCTVLREDKRVSTPLIPLIKQEWWIHGNRRCCASRSIINNVDDMESNNTLALVTWLLEVTTSNGQVTKRTCCWGILNREACDITVWGGSAVGLRVSDSCSLCSQVCCGNRKS